MVVKTSFLLISGDFFHRRLSEISTVGSKLSKKDRLKVVDLIPKGSEFFHLVASGEIIFKKGSDFVKPEVEINIVGYFLAMVRFWPDHSGIDCTP